MRVLLYFLLLLSGNLCLVGGLFLTRLTWRSDVAPYGLRSRAFHIVLRPELYAKPDRLLQIRVLNGIGALLILGALAVVGYDIYLVSFGR